MLPDEAFAAFPRDAQTALHAKARLLEHFGPQLGPPHVDALKGSKRANMKELRFDEHLARLRKRG